MRYILLALASLAASDAHAAFYDGNVLYQFCNTDRNVVAAYVGGWADKRNSDGRTITSGIMATMTQQQATKLTVAVLGNQCVPDGVRLSQLTDIVCKYLEENPGFRQYDGDWQIVDAINQAFPCKQ